MTRRNRFRVHKGRVLSPDFANSKTWSVVAGSTNKSVDIGPMPAEQAGAGSSGTQGDASGDVNSGFLANVIDVHNGAGAAVRAYVGGRLRDDPSYWFAGTWQAADAPDYTDSTAAVQAAAGAMEIVSTVINDGFVLGAYRKFNAVVLQVSNHVAGGTKPTEVYQYWNGAWVTLGTFEAPALYAEAAEQQVIMFNPPEDWALTTVAAPGAGIPAGGYVIRVLDAAASSDTAEVDRIFVGTVRWGCLNVGAAGNVRAEGVEIALCSMDEAPWAVFTTGHANSRALVTGQKTTDAGVVGESHTRGRID
jgi:hypothetical protein